MTPRRHFLLAALAGASFILAGTVSMARAAGAAHGFSFENIDGGTIALADFAGRPVLVVNTASRCGFTPQYEGLQTLWERYRDRGLVVLGVPSDDFNQELSSEAAVKEFCSVNFAIDFPMTTITPVRGDAAHPFFAWAADQHGAPSWNFNKYLVGPDGALLGRWGSSTTPAALAKEIEPLLGAGG
jgi:glutathione peroxidase